MARAKPTKTYRQRLEVRVMSVPFDMMRYDNCVPATEEESGKLERIAGHDPTLKPEDRIVEFRRFALVDKEPTIDRWRSFGCEVVSWENVQ